MPLVPFVLLKLCSLEKLVELTNVSFLLTTEKKLITRTSTSIKHGHQTQRPDTGIRHGHPGTRHRPVYFDQYI